MSSLFTVLIIQWTLFITTFVIPAKFIIMSVLSAQKSAVHAFFHWQSRVDCSILWGPGVLESRVDCSILWGLGVLGKNFVLPTQGHEFVSSSYCVIFISSTHILNRVKRSCIWRSLMIIWPVPGCSKLTTSLVNVLLKFPMLISEICKYFLLKKCDCESFSLFFQQKISVYLVIKS